MASGSSRLQREPSDRRWPATRLLVAVGLLVAGLGAFLAGSSLPGPGVRLVAANQPVNAGAGDPMDLDAHNSPSVVRNPVDQVNVAVANRIDTPSFSCALHVSHDDALSWDETEIPFPAGEESPPPAASPPTWPSVPTARCTCRSSRWPGRATHRTRSGWSPRATEAGRCRHQRGCSAPWPSRSASPPIPSWQGGSSSPGWRRRSPPRWGFPSPATPSSRPARRTAGRHGRRPCR